jgi:peptidoglycan hydrolase-like protein with peptidoglycan-binding domain
MSKNLKKFLVLAFLILTLPSFSSADSYAEKRIFFVDKNYDYLKREKILATNLAVTDKAYFYVEDDFWTDFSQSEKQEFYNNLQKLAKEFNLKIYPTLTSIFGSEPKVGVNGDLKITILIHRMRENVGGYSRESDNFEKKLAPASNERKMLYLNAFSVGENIVKSNLAHEFCHLIQFEQKTKEIPEERWIQEMIAEIAPTLLGYSENLEQRIKLFKKYPQDPILEWKDSSKDYGALSIFAHYLLDQFGKNFFVNLLKTKETGISAIEKITGKDFSEIFQNFLIASFINDCSFGSQYCYKTDLLKNLRVLPELHFLPITGDSILTVFRQIKDFSGDWQKIYGGKGNLTLDFDGEDDGDFSISYILCDKEQICSLNFLKTDEKQKATLSIPDFDKDYFSLTLITFSKAKTAFVEGEAKSYNFSLKISFKQPQRIPTTPVMPVSTSTFSCSKFERNLRYGMRGSDVKCLQEVLKIKEPEIYPEGLVTGYFGPLTLRAVIKFQEKYKDEILAPWGLEKGTGFVGKTTRAKLNAILSGTSSIASIAKFPCEGIIFKRNLSLGSVGEDVKCLQYLLNQDPQTKLAKTGPGSPNNETFYFGPLTFNAVIRFQEKYKDEILAPWGLEKGTGFVGKTTRAKLNAILKELKI